MNKKREAYANVSINLTKTDSKKKFMPLPSLAAGLCFGLCNFFLGMISEDAVAASYIFSIGAIAFAIIFRAGEAAYNRYTKGTYFVWDNSNFYEGIHFNWMNLLGLILRATVNITYQLAVLFALMYASRAGLNQGVVSSIFSLYCVYTSIIFYFLFHERLTRKLVLGIFLMISCVFFIAISHYVQSDSIESQDDHSFRSAIGLSCLIPLIIAIFMSISKYWT